LSSSFKYKIHVIKIDIQFNNKKMDNYFNSTDFMVEICKHLELPFLIKMEKLNKKWRDTIRSHTWINNFIPIVPEMLKYNFINPTIVKEIKTIDNQHKFDTDRTKAHNSGNFLCDKIYLFEKRINIYVNGAIILTDRLFHFLTFAIIKHVEPNPIKCTIIYMDRRTADNIKKEISYCKENNDDSKLYADLRNNIAYRDFMCAQMNFKK